ncbi:hypothetical protein RIF29_00378 [Crotalaria pallida]|uniref:Pentatricopeptide repeat protein n=1 Tax=Crotalaria pallida TaxID=3830 RepID=A0AAN9IVL7_CROPI
MPKLHTHLKCSATLTSSCYFPSKTINTHNLFDEIIHRDISSLNSLITSYIRRGNPFSAWTVFHQVHHARSDLDAFTFTPILRACSMLPYSNRGKQVHAHMIKIGADSGTVVKTALLDMYSRYGSLVESKRVFEEMGHKDIVAWNALLSSFLRFDLPLEALGVLREMRIENVVLSEFTLCSAVKCCASLKALELGRQVHGLVVAMGSDLVVLSTALIDFYSSVGCVNDALKVFYSLKGRKDDMMHNSMVSGCVRNKRYDEAFKFMSLVRPNAIAITSALVGCSENSELCVGKQIHCVAVPQGFTYET